VEISYGEVLVGEGMVIVSAHVEGSRDAETARSASV